MGLVGLLGLFAALVTHVAYLNWMWFPVDHTLAMSANVVIGWLLAGLAMAAIVGRRKPAALSQLGNET